MDAVGEELATSNNYVYALLRKDELNGIKIGGRWRLASTWTTSRFAHTLRRYIPALATLLPAPNGTCPENAPDGGPMRVRPG